MFVDIDPVTYNLDPSQIEAKITPQTRAIIPVHLFGQCCDMDAIWDIAEEHQLYVVEGGDHSLAVTKGQLKAAGETQDDVEERVLGKIRDFVTNQAA